MAKRILFDLYTPQAFVGGAGEYIRKVFYTLLEAAPANDVQIVGLFDSRLSLTTYPDLAPEALAQRGVEAADLRGTTLADIITRYRIDRVFIGAAQYWGATLDVEHIPCPVVCVVHDLMDEEFATSRIIDFLLLPRPVRLLRSHLSVYKQRLLGRHVGKGRMQAIMRMAQANPSCRLVTVSEYTKATLCYHFDIAPERITVCYSPQRITHAAPHIDNKALRSLVATHEPYYVILSANRLAKNAEKAIHAFRRYIECTGRKARLVTVGYPQPEFAEHITLPYLSESDLWHLLDNAYALLFPSVFEGFGYPPVEAMAHGKPVLAANVTSMPEVLGPAALYFSPLYESDIFRALCTLTDSNHAHYAALARKRHDEIAQRQTDDLKRLVRIITNNEE